MEKKSLAKSILFGFVFPMYYRMKSHKKISKKAVFLEIRYDKITDNLALLKKRYEEKKDYEVVEYFLRVGEGSQSEYVSRCFETIRVISDAELIFIDESSNFLSALPIRKKSRIIQTWHGCGAFKRFGHGLNKVLSEEYYKNYYLVPVSAEAVVKNYCESMNHGPDVIKALGVSRTDIFFNDEFLKESRDRLAYNFPESRGKKTILYAPTFRGNVARAEMPICPDIKRLYDELSDDYVILYKGHPAIKDKPKIPEGCEHFFFNVENTMTTDELISSCDLCINDYSSLIFEYSIFERPMIFYAYDLSEYDDGRGFYYPYEKLVPGPIVKDTEGLIKAIRQTEIDFSFKDRIRRFREKFMGACDGHSTDRIVEYIEEGN